LAGVLSRLWGSHEAAQRDAPSCGVIVASAVTGRPTSTIERVLIRAHCRVDSLNACDMATSLDRFGLSLWLTDGFEEPVPLEVWLWPRDERLLALIVEDGRGPRHWLGCRGLAICDGGRWSRGYDARWSVKAAYAVEREA
jgi:hypothetical protein